MTESERLREEGVRVDLAVRGRALRLQPDGPNFTGYVEALSPESGQFQIEREVGAASRVSLLRSDLGATEIGIGSAFKELASGQVHRVKEIPADPASVMARFNCEMGPA